MADIFVSYATEDRDRIRPLVERLEREGWSVWWDRALVAGPRFDEKIEQELDAARCVLVAWSNHSVNSRWCRSEANEGLERNILVPLCIDEVRPPLAFRSSHTASLTGWPYHEGDLVAVLSGIRDCLGAATPSRGERDPDTMAMLPMETRRAHPPKIVILPVSYDAKNEQVAIWADGLPDGIVRSLSSTTFELVLGQTRHLAADSAEIGRELDAEYVVSSNLRVFSANARITVRLIDIRTREQLWSNRQDCALDSLLEQEDAFLETLSRRIRESVRAHELQQIRHLPRDKLDAWALCTLGAVAPTDAASADESLEVLDEACAADPEYGVAYGELAWLVTLCLIFGLSRDPISDKAKALASADRALELAPDNPQVLNNCSFTYRALGNKVLALELARRAAAVTGTGWGRRELHFALISNGRAAEVIAEAQQQPLAVTPLAMSCALVALGQYQEALSHAQAAVGLEPRNSHRWSQLANILGHLGRFNEARDALEQAARHQPDATLMGYEERARIMWRDDPEIVEKMVGGIRQVDLD
jgi:adenylate cyclase